MTPTPSSDALGALVEALGRLPGVGVKSAQRMAYHLLQHDHGAARRLAFALTQALERVGHCERCHTFSETALCRLCADPKRDAQQLCVVESPADLAAMERSGGYRGHYFVLLGRVSPLEGKGPREINLDGLLQRARDPALKELIVATNFTAEGEVTAHVVAQAVKELGLNVTRLARGVPAGSELEYVDLGTLAHALYDRR